VFRPHDQSPLQNILNDYPSDIRDQILNYDTAAIASSSLAILKSVIAGREGIIAADAKATYDTVVFQAFFLGLTFLTLNPGTLNWSIMASKNEYEKQRQRDAAAEVNSKRSAWKNEVGLALEAYLSTHNVGPRTPFATTIRQSIFTLVDKARRERGLSLRPSSETISKTELDEFIKLRLNELGIRSRRQIKLKSKPQSIDL
jgi:hypothetical protein